MKIIIILAAVFCLSSCQNKFSNIEVPASNQTTQTAMATEEETDLSAIRKVDFQNFTFPWTKNFGFGEKTFTLKNSSADLMDERKLTLENVTYGFVADGYDDEQALVNIRIGDGNGTYQMLYVYAMESKSPKLLESFEFELDDTFRAAFGVHGELVIETFDLQTGDSYCCPSIVKISSYKWQKDKFVLQGEAQKIPNSYVERIKKTNKIK